MTETLLQRVWTWLHETFPERQIYIRSDGRVQFFTFGPSLQATLAGLTLIFLGWVAFATVNVIFKDRIIAATDHRYQQMQSAYENRVADLQLSYDELNGALVAAEDRFKATADALAAKQNAITGFLSRESEANAAMGRARNAPAPRQPMVFGAAPQDNAGAEALVAPQPLAVDGEDAGSSALPMMEELPAPQPRTGQPAQKAGLLDRAMEKLGSLLAPARNLFQSRAPARPVSAAHAQHPALKSLAEQTARIAAIGQSETLLLARAESALQRSVGNLRSVIRASGINPEQFARRVAAAGSGGPEIPLDQVRLEGVSDPEFTRVYLRASAVQAELELLTAAVRHVPLVLPVNEAAFDRSSGFGARVDPFTGRYAFHPGIDFAGPWGAKVVATAPGTVRFTGSRGAYGKMIEIDHGFGIHTRYGHLSAINVRPGMRVTKGTDIGRVGSTGRSTGPHVHYEIWYDDKVRNPSTFIEAGRHVL
jgi:murein DD-endopeptidase MepM/ murein hydrolase activator NlpD